MMDTDTTAITTEREVLRPFIIPTLIGILLLVFGAIWHNALRYWSPMSFILEVAASVALVALVFYLFVRWMGELSLRNMSRPGRLMCTVNVINILAALIFLPLP